MKKYVLILFCLIFTVTNLLAQDFVKELSEVKKVEILELYGNLEIEGVEHGKFQITKGNQKDLPKDAKMAKPEYYRSENTQTGLCFEYYNGIVIISPANQEAQFTNYKFLVPESAQLEIKTKSLDKKIVITDKKNTEIYNTISVRKMQAEINIEVFASDINLFDVTGPLSLAIFVGNYNIEFSELNQVNPSVIELFAGNVDVSLPDNTDFNIHLGAEVGEIYSEFKIDIEETKPLILSKEEKFFMGNPEKTLEGKSFLQDRTPNVGKKYDYSKVIGKVNQGGVGLTIHTFAGNVNLKKI